MGSSPPSLWAPCWQYLTQMLRQTPCTSTMLLRLPCSEPWVTLATEETARSWWDISKRTDETWNSLYHTRHLENLSDSKQDILTYITLSCFLDFLLPSCYNFVVPRHPEKQLLWQRSSSRTSRDIHRRSLPLLPSTQPVHVGYTSHAEMASRTTMVSIHQTLLRGNSWV